MATRASKFVWAARGAAVASAHSTRAGAVTSRAAHLGSGLLGSRLAGAAWSRMRIGASDFGRLGPDVLPGRSCLAKVQNQTGQTYRDASDDDALSPFSDRSEHLQDDGVVVTEKDLESDEALWALYERWCKAFNKERDHAEMVRRFPEFKFSAIIVNNWNTYVPDDPERAATFLEGKREAELRRAKGLDVPHWYEPMELGPFADGKDPLHSEHSSYLNEDQEMDKSPANAAY
ncbi:unnamed protein product [Urochloa humidicola]